MKNYQFFCDFDGTITKEDTLNKFLCTYAGENWLDIEDDWIKGKIGSKECIEKQMQLFDNVDEQSLNDFINSIEIDETFPDFLNYLKLQGIDFYIVSDGFDYFIERILKKYNISGVKIFSNKLEIKNRKFRTYFPNYNPECIPASGVCKCNVIKSSRIVTKRVLYAGDGLSDFCAAKNADFLFAKGKLLEYGRSTHFKNLIEFNTFAEIKDYIKML